MSNAKQETIADIVDAMRNEGHTGEASCLEWIRAKMTYYADRIEEAAMREKPSQLGNAAKMRDTDRIQELRALVEGLLKASTIECASCDYDCGQNREKCIIREAEQYIKEGVQDGK